jgi:hypothetical protein
MKRNEGCGTRDSILALYARTEQGKLLPPLDGFRGIPCGFELFINEFGGRVILLCESCAVKNGYLGAWWPYLPESPSPGKLSERESYCENGS